MVHGSWLNNASSANIPGNFGRPRTRAKQTLTMGEVMFATNERTKPQSAVWNQPRVIQTTVAYTKVFDRLPEPTKKKRIFLLGTLPPGCLYLSFFLRETYRKDKNYMKSWI